MTRKNILDLQLFPQPDGTMWVADNIQKQLLKFEGRQLKLTIPQKDFSFKGISDIETDPQGNTWFNDSRDSSLTRFDGKTFKKLIIADGLPETGINFILPIADDSIFLSTRIATYFYNGYRSVKIIDSTMFLFVTDKEGTIWISKSTSDGMVANKISSSGMTTIGRKDGLDVFLSFNLGIDKEDNAWALSQNTINRLYKPVTTYNDIFPTSFSFIRCFYNDRDNNYWFGSIPGGLSFFKGSILTNYSFLNYDEPANRFQNNNINSITQDQTGNMWIATGGGSLIKFDGKSFTNYKSNESSVKFLNNLLMDRKGNIWFSEGSGTGSSFGAGYFNGTEKVSFTTAQGLCDNTVWSIYEDNKGTMWFGTPNGLSRYKDGRFTTFNVSDGLPSRAVYQINGDDYGNIWLGTALGISRFDGEQFINYTIDDGNGTNNINNIVKDTINHLFWISTNDGFTAMKINANHPDSVVFENYSEAEGFALKGTHEFLIDHQGTLWLSEGLNSMKRFDYKQIKKSSKPFKLHIAQIRLNNETICWSNLKGIDKDSSILQAEMLHKKIEEIRTKFING